MGVCSRCDGTTFYSPDSLMRTNSTCLDCGDTFNNEEQGTLTLKRVNELRIERKYPPLMELRKRRAVELEHTMYIEVNPPRANGTFIDVADWSRKYQKDIEAQIYNAIRKLGFKAKIKVKINY